MTEEDVEEVDGATRTDGTRRRQEQEEGEDQDGLRAGRASSRAFREHAGRKSDRSDRLASSSPRPRASDPNEDRQEAAEELRRVVATVGKPGQPGEQVRCVVSVSMLTEGWDANNVTHILGAAGLRQPAPLRAGRRPRAAADELHARPEDGPPHRGIRGRLRDPVLAHPVQGTADEQDRRRRTSRRTTSGRWTSGSAWRSASPSWRAMPSPCGGT